jgi:hypothetical protein
LWNENPSNHRSRDLDLNAVKEQQGGCLVLRREWWIEEDQHGAVTVGALVVREGIA